MTELHFHSDLYDGFAIDEAVKVYADFASSELTKDEHGYTVKLTVLPAATESGYDEALIAAELGNYALGKTIERAGAAEMAPGGAA